MNKNKKRILIITLVVLFLIFLMTLFINIHMVNSTKDKIVSLDKVNEITDIDAIIILGCKVEDGIPSLMLSKRLEKGIDVYNKLHTKIIVSGDGNKEDEVNVMSNYLINSGIESNDIVKDQAGISTYDSIYRAKNVFSVKKIVIVTQDYHMYRALYLANKLDIKAYGVVADDIPQKLIMLKNKIREIFSRDKNYFLGLLKPESKYLGEKISLNQDNSLTED